MYIILIGDFLAEILVRLEGAQELLLEKLTKNGFYKNRSEVIRAAIIGLAKEQKVFNSFQELEDELVFRKAQQMDELVKKGKVKTIPLSTVKAKYKW